MTSFELVNHQIRHIFGGIEAEKNASLEHLQNEQRKITKMMEKAQCAHKKIYQSMVAIKSSFLQLAENYLGISKQTKLSGGLINKLSMELNVMLQDVSEQSLSLSKKMESKAESYLPNLKKIKQKYTETAENLEHYRRKVSLLKKSVNKQSLANIKQEEHERFQRNKQKLKNAQKEYDQILLKVTKRFIQFNNEGVRDLYNDLITIFSTFGGDVMIMNQRIMKYLNQNVTSRQILLSKQIRNNVGSENRNEQSSAKIKQQNAIEQNQYLFEHLVKQKQIANYLKTMIDRELTKSYATQRIQQLFSKVQPSKEMQQFKQTNNIFAQFKNEYNNQQLQHQQKIATQKIGNEQQQVSLNACQDLLQMQEPTEISYQPQNESIINCDISLSPEPSQDKKKQNNTDPEWQNKIRANLDKFNQICQQNSISKVHKVGPKQKNQQNLNVPQIKLSLTNHNSKNVQIINSSQFFNVNFFEEKQSKPNQKLSLTSQNPSKSPNPHSVNKSNQKLQTPNVNGVSPNERKKSELFTNFDQLMNQKKKNLVQISQKKKSEKSTNKEDNLIQFSAFIDFSSSVKPKIPSKAEINNYDLLNL